MHYEKNQLVRHATLGLGKVLAVDGHRVTVFFKDQTDNPSRTIVAERLELAEVQKDPWLDHLDAELVAGGKLKTYVTQQGAIERFLARYPTGFTSDPSSAYWKDERGYKWEAHVVWNQLLDRATFKGLLDGGKYREIVTRALRTIGSVDLVSRFHKTALHDGLAGEEAARAFAFTEYEFLYGKGTDEARFTRLVDMLHSLPQAGTATATWTTATIVPF